jgi:hypothetical protein
LRHLRSGRQAGKPNVLMLKELLVVRQRAR